MPSQLMNTGRSIGIIAAEVTRVSGASSFFPSFLRFDAEVALLSPISGGVFAPEIDGSW